MKKVDFKKSIKSCTGHLTKKINTICCMPYEDYWMLILLDGLRFPESPSNYPHYEAIRDNGAKDIKKPGCPAGYN